MSIKFYNVELKSENNWLANINRNALKVIGKSKNCANEDVMFKIITYGDVEYSKLDNTLEVEPDKSEFTSLGILVCDKVLIEKNERYKKFIPKDNKIVQSENVRILFDSSGESKFKRMLLNQEDGLNKLGLELLKQVRTFNSAGTLKYHDRSKVFVESPNNFWAVSIHPKAKHLMITVRGPIEAFRRLRTHLELKEDRPGYIKFYIEVNNQISEAIKIIKEARWH